MDSQSRTYPLSESQKSIWYLEKAYPGTSLNIVAGTLRIKEDVCYSALKKALNLFVTKNASMRLRISEEDGTAVQYLADDNEFDVDFYDFGSGGLKELFAWDEATTQTPFDIVDKPLFYCAVFRVGDDEGGFYMKMHHLISDAWTMGLLGRQVIGIYSRLRRGEPVDDTPNPSYLEHLASESEYEKSPRFITDKAYWLKKFETLTEPTVLKPQKAGLETIRARRKTLVTPLKLSNKIREFSGTHRVSVFTLFMSALAIYINRVTGLDEITLGTTILNRTSAREKETTGMFVSVAAPVRISIDDTTDFITFSKAMLRENTDVLRHQKYPYNYLIRDLKKKHLLSGRLFDIVLTYQNSKFHKNESDVDYTAKWLFSGYQVESLVISINDREDGGNLIIDYDFLADVYSTKEIEFIHQHVINLLWHALDNPVKRISRLEMISEKEKNKLLYEFNDTDAGFPRDKTIHEIFEAQAEKFPENTALVFKDETMTYRRLNEKANRLARTLRAGGVLPDDVVGIISDRSFDMVVAILGVLKAGGAYMPIDPAFPEDRAGFMLENSGARVLLTKRAYDLPFGGTKLYLDDASAYHDDASNLDSVSKPSNLAYIIYTSGSTGKPKGVMTEHRNVIGLFLNDAFVFKFGASDVWTFFHSYCFDLSAWEMYNPLLRGGKLILIGLDEVKDTQLYLDILKKEKVTVLTQTPQSMYNLIDLELKSAQKELSIRYVILGGEALKPALLKPFKKRYPDCEFYNQYGPTETTLYVTQKRLQESDFDSNQSNIGKVNPLTKAYIVDRNVNLNPIGIPGELCISGNGVSRGYINNPQLTKEKFIDNPFVKGEVLYKTGDLVRIMPAGDIIYLGRTDGQVKIRGYRVELGEIEARLTEIEEISSSVVITRTSPMGDSQLCAYYVSDKQLVPADIKKELASKLPSYMIPSFFMRLGSLPLNASGKVDRKALPEPQGDVLTRQVIPPESRTEIALAEIWKEVLGIDSVSMNDNFFELGGSSLSAVRLAALVYKVLGVEISTRVIFQSPELRELGAQIESKMCQAYTAIPAAASRDGYPLSWAEKRHYLLQNTPGLETAYSVTGVLLLDGTVRLEKLESVFKIIIERHEALRTSVEVRNGELVQVVHDSSNFRIEPYQLNGSDYDGTIKEFIRPFDVGSAPLFRVGLASDGSTRYLLMIDMSHIISDTTSVKILFAEIMTLYNGGELPKLSIQYKDYSEWHNGLMETGKMSKQKAYWLDRLSGEIPALKLPYDSEPSSVRSRQGDRLYFVIDQATTAEIKKLAAEKQMSLFTVLLTAFKMVLFAYSGQSDIAVCVPFEGRNHPDLQNLIGTFENPLIIRSSPAGEKTAETYLNEIRELLFCAADNQDYPIELLLESLDGNVDQQSLLAIVFDMVSVDLSNLSTPDFSFKPYPYNNKISRRDIKLDANDLGEIISCGVEYSTELFHQQTMKQFFARYLEILKAMLQNPSMKLSEISF